MHNMNGQSVRSAPGVARVTPLILTVSAALSCAPLAGYATTVTRYTYDTGDNVTSVNDPRGLVTTYVRDGLGQKWQDTSPDTGTTRYDYDSYGRLHTLTRADGNLITYGYDAIGRQTSLTVNGVKQYWTYDSCTNGVGRLCSVFDSTGKTTYTYTPEGWMAGRGFAMGNTSYALGYSYNALGQVTSLAYPDGTQALYTYTNGVVSALQVNQGGTVSNVATQLVYGAGNRYMTQWRGNSGLAATLTYDTDGRLTHLDAPGVQSIDVSYDTANRIVGIANGVDLAMTQAIDYDGYSRVTEVASAANNESFQYDANGNRTQHTLNGAMTNVAINPSSNQVMALSGAINTQYAYEARGNLAAVNGSSTFNYNDVNRLSAANGNTYYVNPEGQRLRKTVSGTSTYFAPDSAGPLLGEAQGGAWTDYLWINGRLVGRITGGQIQNIYTDQTGRPEVATDRKANVVWRARNYAFDREVTISNTAALNLGFLGQYYDAESGLWNNGYRDYDASSGRYVESDPVGLAGGINTYIYVQGNPLSHVDPLGLTQADVLLMTALVRTNERDIQVPNGPVVWFKDVNLSQSQYVTIRQEGTYQKIGDSMSLNDKYLGPLDQHDLIDLYDTIVHESLHKTLGPDSAKPNEHACLSQQAHTRTAAASNLIGQYFGYGL